MHVSTTARSGLLVAALGLTACASVKRTEPPAKVAEQALAGNPSKEKGDLLDELALSPEQRTSVDALRERLDAQLLGVADARHVLVDTVADAIGEGKIDHTKVDPAARLFIDAVERVRPAILDDLNEVHRILTPKQRAEIALRTSGKKEDDEPKKKGSGDRTKRIMDALDLSFSQTLALTAALATLADRSDDVTDLKNEFDAAADAFQADSFDARNLAIAKAPIAEIVIDQGFAVLELVLPELNDYQHHVLAELARQMLDPKPPPGIR